MLAAAALIHAVVDEAAGRVGEPLLEHEELRRPPTTNSSAVTALNVGEAAPSPLGPICPCLRNTAAVHPRSTCASKRDFDVAGGFSRQSAPIADLAGRINSGRRHLRLEVERLARQACEVGMPGSRDSRRTPINDHAGGRHLEMTDAIYLAILSTLLKFPDNVERATGMIRLPEPICHLGHIGVRRIRCIDPKNATASADRHRRRHCLKRRAYSLGPLGRIVAATRQSGDQHHLPESRRWLDRRA